MLGTISERSEGEFVILLSELGDIAQKSQKMK